MAMVGVPGGTGPGSGIGTYMLGSGGVEEAP
jgi:hypothetical protein